MGETDIEVGEGTPLLSQSWTGDVPLKDLKAATFKERAVAAAAIVGFVTSVLCILFESASNPSVLVTGILGCLLSPYAVLQQKKLTQVEALQETNEALGKETAELSEENVRLQQSAQRLEESVMHLQAMEETLASLQAVQGMSITDMEKQLAESKTILAGMRQNVKGELLQNIVTVLLAVDGDQNMLLSDAEIEALIVNLEGINGVQLKEQLLKDCIVEHGRSIVALMEVARNLMKDDLPDENCIFKFLEEDAI